MTDKLSPDEKAAEVKKQLQAWDDAYRKHIQIFINNPWYLFWLYVFVYQARNIASLMTYSVLGEGYIGSTVDVILHLTVWAYFAAVAVGVLKAIMNLGASWWIVWRAINLVGAAVFFFAQMHFVVLLADTDNSYHGLAIRGEHPTVHLYDMPDAAYTFLNCIYFSAITMATVGYGDIYPVSGEAKLATTAEVATSLILIVVTLSSAIGHARELATQRSIDAYPPREQDNKGVGPGEEHTTETTADGEDGRTNGIVPMV